MDIPRMKKLKEDLMAQIECYVTTGFDKVNTCELGEAVDMVKDLSEALYYCAITKAMEEGEEESGKWEQEPKHRMRYMTRNVKMRDEYYPIEYYDPRYRERYNYPMYSDGKEHWTHKDSHSNGGREDYMMDERGRPVRHIDREDMIRDPHEGRSGMRRKMYMEGKGMKDKTHQMRELESYMQELSEDITDMIQDASPEEKQMLQQKISTLATKIK